MSQLQTLIEGKSKYYKLLMASNLLCRCVYQENPRKCLHTDEYIEYNHKIEELAISLETSLESRYLISNDDESELLIVGVRGSSTLKDFARDGQISKEEIKHKRIKGSVHKGFWLRCNEIPIDYFVDKIVDDGFKVIFTGHSLGAAVAALLTMRVLFDEKIYKHKKLHRKIICIGFGSPAFGDDRLKQCLRENNFTDNFHFYVNKNDIVVDLLMLYESCKMVNQNFRDMILNSSIGANQVLDLNGNNLFASREFQPQELIPYLKLHKPSEYTHFGKFIYLKDNGTYEISDDYKPDMLKIITSADKSYLDDHYVINYFKSLIKIYQTDKVDIKVPKADFIKVEKYSEVNLKSIRKRGEYSVCTKNDDHHCDEYSIKIVKGPANSTYSKILLNVCGRNGEFIVNGLLNVEKGKKIEPSVMERKSRNSILFIFDVKNQLIFTSESESYLLVFEKKIEKLAIEHLDVDIRTHFQEVTFKLSLTESDLTGNNATFKYIDPLDIFMYPTYAIANALVSTLKEYKKKHVELQNSSASLKIKVVVTNDLVKASNEDNLNRAIFSSMQDLNQAIEKAFSLKSPQYRSYTNPMQLVSSFEEFFTSKDDKFVIN